MSFQHTCLIPFNFVVTLLADTVCYCAYVCMQRFKLRASWMLSMCSTTETVHWTLYMRSLRRFTSWSWSFTVLPTEYTRVLFFLHTLANSCYFLSLWKLASYGSEMDFICIPLWSVALDTISELQLCSVCFSIETSLSLLPIFSVGVCFSLLSFANFFIILSAY